MQYDEFYQKKENPIEKFSNISRVFKKYWVENIEENGSEMRIKIPFLKHKLHLWN
jgi:hypothetical protein